MLNTIVRIYIRQVERIRPIIPTEYLGHIAWDEETKGRREVEGGTDSGGQFTERDVASITGYDSCGAIRSLLLISKMFKI